MPFYRVSARELLIEADSPTDAAMAVYRIFEERSPNQFDVVGPDAETNHVTLNDQQQEQAITIASARKSNIPT